MADQFIDRTFAREKSFFGPGFVAHVPMAHPVCPRLSGALTLAAREEKIDHSEGGTYICMEGPQFSTRAESFLYRSWDCSVIGMTAMPEAKLAREAELPYAIVAMVTDYDCWHDDHEHVTVDAVIKVMHQNAANARKLIMAVAPKLGPDRQPSTCPDRPETVLDFALITAPDKRDPALMAKLDAVAGRVSEESKTMDFKTAIRTIPDYPKPGIMFRDITTLLGNPRAFRRAVDEMVQPYAGMKIDKVAGLEARGFILGGAVAHQLSSASSRCARRASCPTP